jgi:ABC-type multidrug transport system fused ATPase/permease subunit
MIAIGLGLLWREVGVAALPGVALMIIFTVVSGYFGGRIMEIRKKSLAAADLRIRIISEIVQAIKLVKMLGWQQQIVSSVKRARATETASLVSLAMIKSLNITVSFVSSLLIIAATFSVYVASSDVLVSAKAFTVLSLFNVLRFPLIMLPMTMKFVGECWVAFQRIENFLEQEEAEEDPHLSAQSCGKDKALVMRDCVMSWDGKTPTLQGNPEELPPAHEAAGADSNLTHTFSSSPVASNATVSSDSAVEHVAHVSESPFSVHESSVVKSPKPADNVASLHVDSSKTFNGLHLSIPKGSFLSVVGAVGAGMSLYLPHRQTQCFNTFLQVQD